MQVKGERGHGLRLGQGVGHLGVAVVEKPREQGCGRGIDDAQRLGPFQRQRGGAPVAVQRKAVDPHRHVAGQAGAAAKGGTGAQILARQHVQVEAAREAVGVVAARRLQQRARERQVAHPDQAVDAGDQQLALRHLAPRGDGQLGGQDAVEQRLRRRQPRVAGSQGLRDVGGRGAVPQPGGQPGRSGRAQAGRVGIGLAQPGHGDGRGARVGGDRRGRDRGAVRSGGGRAARRTRGRRAAAGRVGRNAVGGSPPRRGRGRGRLAGHPVVCGQRRFGMRGHGSRAGEKGDQRDAGERQRAHPRPVSRGHRTRLRVPPRRHSRSRRPPRRLRPVPASGRSG